MRKTPNGRKGMPHRSRKPKGYLLTLPPEDLEGFRNHYQALVTAKQRADEAQQLAQVAASAYDDFTSGLSEKHSLPPRYDVDLPTGNVTASPEAARG